MAFDITDINVATTEEQITALYLGYFGRAPDPVGLTLWKQQLDEYLENDDDGVSGRSLEDIASAFSRSAESRAEYKYFDDFYNGVQVGAVEAQDNAEVFINQVYLNLFGRPADPAGLEGWTANLMSGNFTTGEIILKIIEGARNADVQKIENKIETALYFRDEAVERGVGKFEDVPGMYDLARTITDNVDENTASVDAAKAVVDSFYNDAPIAANDTAAVNEDGILDDGVISTAADPDGDALTYSVAAGGAPANGTVVMNADGTYVYTPDADFNGTDTFTYTVTDPSGETDSATVTVTVAPQNDAPIAGAIQGGAIEGGAVATVDLKDVTSDVDGDTLTYALVTSADGLSIDASTGVVSLDPTVEAYDGLAQGETLQVVAGYSVSDGAKTVQGTVQFTVTGTNDAPVASASVRSVDEDGAVFGTVRATDVDGSADNLVYSVEAGDGPTNGTLSMDADGAYTYTPDADFNGTDSFTYTVTDTDGGQATAVGTITVTAVDDAPVASNATTSVNEDATISGQLVASDVDNDDAAIVYTLDTNVAGLTLNADGSWDFDASNSEYQSLAAGETQVVSTTYTATSNGKTDTGSITITVTGTNDAPVAAMSSKGVAEDGSVSGVVVATDVDSDSAGFVYSVEAGDGPANGVLNIDSNGAYTYTPDADFNGTDSFTYTVTDTDGGQATAVGTITVTAVDDAPVAQDATAAVAEDATLSGQLSATDVDNNDADITYALNQSVAGLTLNADGSWEFDAGNDAYQELAAGETNVVQTTYTATSNGKSDSGVITITVTGTNDAPVATASILSGPENTDITSTVSASDVDGSADDLVYAVTADPANGTVVMDADGSFTYTPNTEFNGEDSFTYTVTDANGATDTSTVTLILAPMDDLTSEIDTVQGPVINSIPEYTPAGNDLVNTLQSEDTLRGTAGENDEFNVTLGSINDGAESLIQADIADIEIFNLQVTGSSDQIGLDFQNTTGAEVLNIERITADSATSVVLQDMKSDLNEINLNNATRNGELDLNWAEGELEGLDDTLDLGLNNVVQSALMTSQGSGVLADVPEDEGYGFETINVSVTGSTNLDMFTLNANAEEQRAAEGAGNPRVTQSIIVDALHDLEINSFNAEGAEFIDVTATGDVVVTGNERTNADGNINFGLDASEANREIVPGVNAGLHAAELEVLTIDGSGDVTINGLTTDLDSGTNDVEIAGGAMTGDLAIRVMADIAEGEGSTLESGSGNDEIITHTGSEMDITTNEGDDTIRIQGDAGRATDNDLDGTQDTISTGAGNDDVFVGYSDYNGTVIDADPASTGTTPHNSYADFDTAAGADTITIAGNQRGDINTGSENDAVTVGGNLDADTVATETGNDDVTVGGDITVADMTTAEGVDTVVAGSMTNTNLNTGSDGDSVSTVGNVTDSAIATEGGDDIVTIGSDLTDGTVANLIGSTIATADGDDTVAIEGNAEDSDLGLQGNTDADIDLGTGIDALTVGGNLGADVVAGSDAETNNDDGQDTITVAGNMEGTATITTQAGDDSVTISGELGVVRGDYVGAMASTLAQYADGAPVSEAADANAYKQPGKTADNTNFDVTEAASINTGDGSDTVATGSLRSAAQYNDNVIVGDADADDTITIVGASINTGAGADSVTLTQLGGTALVGEGASVDTGADADTVTVNMNAGVMLEADNAKTGLLTDREGPVVGTQDTAGAMLMTGAGDDTIAVNGDMDSDPVFDDMLLVDRGAVLDAGAGSDSLTIRATDDVEVVQSKAYQAVAGDNDDVTDGSDIVMGGVNAEDAMDGQGGYINGVETINLIAENSLNEGQLPGNIVDPSVQLADAAIADSDADNNTPAAIDIDVEQVDTDLQTLNLTANEQRELLEDTTVVNGVLSDAVAVGETGTNETTGSFSNLYVAGGATTFEVDNFRSNVDLNLAAYEVNGVADNPVDSGFDTDGGADIFTAGSELEDNCDSDVTVTVNMDAQAASQATVGAFLDEDDNRSFTLNLNANTDLANQTGEENYDVRIVSENQFMQDASDTVVVDPDAADDAADTAEATGDRQLDARYARDIVINVGTGASHHIDVTNTFGGVAGVNHAEWDVYDENGVELGTVDAASAAEAISMFADGDSAGINNDGNDLTQNDTVTSLSVTADTDDEVVVVENAHADTITLSGASDFFMNVDAANDYTITTGSGDDVIRMSADTLTTADSIDGGNGNDTLIISGGQDIPAGVFNNIVNIENLVVEFTEGTSATSNIEVESDQLDQITIVNRPLTTGADEPGINDADSAVGQHVVNLDVSHNQTGTESLLIEADANIASALTADFCPPEDNNLHSDELVLNIDTTIDDALVGAPFLTDLDISVNVSEGTAINLTTHNAEEIDIVATVSALATTDVAVGNGGDDEGELQIVTAAGDIETITLDGDADNQNVVVTVDNSWAADALFIDGRQVVDASNANLFDGSAEVDASLTIHGTTVNNDDESVFTAGGNDTILGGRVGDFLYGEGGNDLVEGGLGVDTIDGGEGDDYIEGDQGGDVLTGSAGADTFALGETTATAQLAIDESNAGLNGASADTITDFETGVDTLEINLGDVNGFDGNGDVDFVDLSSFAVVSTEAQGDDSLGGTVAQPVMGDMYYSTDADSFVMDVDGSGDVTTNDITVRSANAINAGDISVQLDTGAGDDILRLGQGVDRLSAGIGNDTFVIVGALTTTDVANYAADLSDNGVLNAVADFGLTNVVDENQLLTARGQTEANAGDSLFGQDGNDTLHVYGTVNLTGTALDQIENLVVHSTVTITTEQLYKLNNLVFDGNTEHQLIITGPNGEPLSVDQQLTAMSVLAANGGVVSFNGSPSVTVGDTVFTDETVFNNALFDGLLDLPGQPVALDLANADDSNVAGDDITNQSEALTFSGTADAFVNVTVFNDIDGDNVLDNGEYLGETTAGEDGSWEVDVSFTDGDGTYNVKAFGTDENGLRSQTSAGLTVELDTTAPVAPSITIIDDTGASAADNITSANGVTVSGLETDTLFSWEYSLNGGEDWTEGTGTSFNLDDDVTYAEGDVLVRQTDVAGNTSAVGSNVGEWVEDSTAPVAPTIAIMTDSGLSGEDDITNDNTIEVLGLEADATWEYSLNGGTTWADGTGNSFELTADTTFAAGDVRVRQTDVAGNLSAEGSNAGEWVEDSTNPDYVGVAVSDVAINADDDAGTTVTIAVTYTEAMDPSITPTIGFSPDVSTTLVSQGAGVWSVGNTVYTESYTVTDVDADIDNVNITVSGGQDVAGNAIADTEFANVVDIDMVSPTITIAEPVEGAVAVDPTDGITKQWINAAEDGDVVVSGTTTDAEVGQTVTVTFEDSDGATVEATTVVLAGNTWTLSGVEADISGLLDGPITVTATVSDLAGNSASDMTTVELDNATPVAPFFTGIVTDSGQSAADELTNDTTPQINGTAEAYATIEVFEETLGSLGTTTADANGDWSFATDGVLSLTDGTYNFSATATDTAGNTSSGEGFSTGNGFTEGFRIYAQEPDDTSPVTGDDYIPSIGTFFQWTGDAEPSGIAYITDPGVGIDGETLEDDSADTPDESATADVTINGLTSIGSDVDAEVAWLVRNVDTGEEFVIVELDVEDGDASGDYTLSERPLDPNATYEVLDRDGVPDTNDTSPLVFTYDNYASEGFEVTVDTTAPVAPTIAITSDTAGASTTDNITFAQTVTVSGLEADATWEYSLDGGLNWTDGEDSSFDLTEDTTFAAGDVQVRQTDVAGNLSAVGSNAGEWIEDSTAPAAPTIAIATDSGSSTSDNITNAATVTVSGLEADATWEYSLDGGSSWTDGEDSSFDLTEDTTFVAGDVQVRQTDVAGNLSAVGSNAGEWIEDSTAPAPSITSASYNNVSNTLVITGTGFDTSDTIDLDSLIWDVNDDGGTTPDISFGDLDGLSADGAVTATIDSSTQITLVLDTLTAAGSVLEGLTGFVGSVEDRLDMSAGFLTDIAGNASTVVDNSSPIALNLTGTDNDDVMYGGVLGDTLNGGLGGDTLIGRAGNDTIDVGADTSVDIVVYNTNTDGTDTILNFDSGEDKYDTNFEPDDQNFNEWVDLATNTTSSGGNVNITVSEVDNDVLYYSGALGLDPTTATRNDVMVSLERALNTSGSDTLATNGSFSGVDAFAEFLLVLHDTLGSETYVLEVETGSGSVLDLAEADLVGIFIGQNLVDGDII